MTWQPTGLIPPGSLGAVRDHKKVVGLCTVLIQAGATTPDSALGGKTLFATAKGRGWASDYSNMTKSLKTIPGIVKLTGPTTMYYYDKGLIEDLLESQAEPIYPRITSGLMGRQVYNEVTYVYDGIPEVRKTRTQEWYKNFPIGNRELFDKYFGEKENIPKILESVGTNYLLLKQGGDNAEANKTLVVMVEEIGSALHWYAEAFDTAV